MRTGSRTNGRNLRKRLLHDLHHERILFLLAEMRRAVRPDLRDLLFTIVSTESSKVKEKERKKGETRES